METILVFGLLGLILLWVAKSKGYFVLPSSVKGKGSHLLFKTVLVVFAIYLAMTIIVAPAAVSIVRSISGETIPIAAIGWIQLLTLATIFILFYLYAKTQPPETFKKIWKDWSVPNAKPILTDFFMGVMTWFIGFPLVIAVGQLADMFLYYFFQYVNYEQVAVRYLKTALSSPFMLIVALLTILIAAPVIEEFLFRGCLQTFFKRFFSVRKSIVFSALCFSMFHFAPSQGIGNFSLIATLFVFALFLGFIYERQASLYASIGLHMTFNAVSTFRILFYPE